MRMLDLFSGIGGFALAAEWVWGDELDITGFCEIEEYAQKVLQKNFPGVPIYDDITKLNGKDFKNIDLITGGFPCQDISVAGKGAGIKEGTRSGLWSELHRIISEVQPRFALIENVPMLTIRGGTRVIANLAEIGYDCEWQVIGADDVGAWHRRKRIWIVAYPSNIRSQKTEQKRKNKIKSRRQVEIRNGITGLRHNVPNTDGKRRPRGSNNETNRCSTNINWKEAEILQTKRKRQNEISNTSSKRLERYGGYKELEVPRQVSNITTERSCKGIRSYWSVEPNVGRVANGIPSRVDRLKGLGNAIVPQVAALIMERIKNAQ